MIKEGYKANFATLQEAAENQDLCLMECTDLKTGQPVVVICAFSSDAEGYINMVPLAKMFDGNPYEEVAPPSGSKPEFD